MSRVVLHTHRTYSMPPSPSTLSIINIYGLFDWRGPGYSGLLLGAGTQLTFVRNYNLSYRRGVTEASLRGCDKLPLAERYQVICTPSSSRRRCGGTFMSLSEMAQLETQLKMMTEADKERSSSSELVIPFPIVIRISSHNRYFKFYSNPSG